MDAPFYKRHRGNDQVNGFYEQQHPADQTEEADQDDVFADGSLFMLDAPPASGLPVEQWGTYDTPLENAHRGNKRSMRVYFHFIQALKCGTYTES